jgi:hemoglobin
VNANHPEQDSTPKPVLLPAGQSLGKPVAQLRPVGASLSASLPEGRLTPNDDHDPSQYEGTFYAQVGGRETFRKLAEKFYESVGEDTEFRAMYPETDLRPATMRLQLFLEQYWGGPTTYSERRGHPRLRMRHVPYTINSHNRDVWLHHMRIAVDSLQLPPLQADTLWDYFDRAAHSLMNAPDEAPGCPAGAQST